MSHESRLALAVDIGGTKIAVAVFRDGKIELLNRFATPDDPLRAVKLITESVEKAGLAAKIGAAGIGAPGPLDSAGGRMLKPPNLRGWWDFPLAKMISESLGCPVRLENDANLGALGEAVFGSGKGLDSVFYLTISTGIGSGLIINGKIHGGRKGMAGEVWAVKPGFFSGNSEGPTIMDLASGPGMVRCAHQRLTKGRESVLSPDELNTRMLIEAALNGDSVAKKTLEDGRDAIAGLLTTVIELIAPDAIILGGGLCTESAWFIDPVIKRIRDWTEIPELADIPVYRAQMWDDAVLYGASQLVADLC